MGSSCANRRLILTAKSRSVRARFRCGRGARRLRQWFLGRRSGPDIAAIEWRRAKALELGIPRPQTIARDCRFVFGQNFFLKDAVGCGRIGLGFEEAESRGLGL